MPTIIEILNSGKTAEATINALKNKSVKVPSWGKLEQEYNPRKHPVFTDPNYTDKVKKGVVEKMTRVTYAMQKQAVKRMKELMFTIPVKRKYSTGDDPQLQQAANIMEAVFKKNHIDAANIKRAHKVFASCEAVTIWYAQAQPTEYAGLSTSIKLRSKTYSPMDGDTIYPLFDEYDDLIALSIEYNRYNHETTRTNTYFDTYTDTQHLRWVSKDGGGWTPDIDPEPINIGKIQGVYIHRNEPIWEDQSENCYELEWSLSRNGNYLRKNSRPTFLIFSDKQKVVTGKEAKDDNEGRSVLRFGAQDKASYATWSQAIDSLRFHTEELRRNIHTTLQLPDMSMEQMKATPMSGEARKMLFIDCQMKVTDESGDWLEFFDREVNVVRAFCKIMFPQLAKAFDTLVVENIITAYKINSLSDDIKDALTATNGKAVASRKTMMRRLALVPEEEIENELDEITAEESTTENMFENEPTI